MNFATVIAVICTVHAVFSAEVRLLDLEPNDAQQLIDKQDTTLKYAPKIESNVPAVRYLGNEPHNVLEDIYLANQYHGQDGLGGYLYGYAVPDIAKTERKKAGGDLTGAYNYIAGNGQEIKVEYWDDGTGFHQIDNVPKILPTQIPDTPEVAAAKAEHARIWAEQAERNSKPIANPYPQQALNPNYQPQQQYQQPQQYQAHQSQQQPQQYHAQQSQQPQQYQAQQTQQVASKPQGLYQQPQQNQQQPQGLYQQPQAYQAQQSQQVPQNQAYQQNTPAASGLINQYQQQKQQYPNPGQSVQYQGDQATQYNAQQTQGVNQYQQQPHQSQDQGDQSGEYKEDNSGEYDPKIHEQEDQGPPKGFFYNFDYPVGIIVNKEGGGAVQKREGDVQDVYSQNKALYEQQLQGGGARSARSSSSYLYIPH